MPGNRFESADNSPDIPYEEQLVVWTGFFISGQHPGRPIDFDLFEKNPQELDGLREVVAASIGQEVSLDDMRGAIEAARIALKDRAL